MTTETASGPLALNDVTTMIADQLGSKLTDRSVLVAETSLESLGLTSLDITEVLLSIEEKVGFELDPSAAADIKSIGDIVATVNGQLQSASQPAETADSSVKA